MAIDDTDTKRLVPKLALYGSESGLEILTGYPGRFTVRQAGDAEELDSLMVGAALDLVILDCRDRIPPEEVRALLRRDDRIDFIAIGCPPDRKQLPSWMISHSCAWPIDRDQLYRLITSAAAKGAAERRLAGLEKELRDREIEAALGCRLAEVLHELGNPLDAVRRFIKLSREHAADDPELTSWLGAADTGLERMAATLLELHRDARRSGTRLRLVELRELLREAVNASGAPDRDIEIVTRVEAEDVFVPESLGSVLVNLLLNARRAITGSGRIELRATLRPDGRPLISVTDDGEGFGELFKDELFKPWFSTRHDESGLGLGLSTARHAVEQLGGSLDAHSPGIGQGATFTIELPATAAANEPAGDAAAEESNE